MGQTNSLNHVVRAVGSATKPSQLGIGPWFYSNGHHRGTPADLMNGSPGNLAGYSEIPLSMGFDYHSSQPTFERMRKFSINPTIIGDYVYIRTANVLRAFPRKDAEMYGIPLVLEDYEIKGWKAATEESTGGGISYHDVPEFRAFVVSSHERRAKHEPYKFVTEMEIFGPNNRIGEMLSRSETLRQDALKHFNSKEGYQLMLENLADSEEIEYLGVTSVGRILYAIGRRVNDGKIVLFTGINTYDKIAPEADAFNLTLDDMIPVKLGEEAMHHYRRSYDRNLSTLESLVNEERATKEDLLVFYMRLRDESESNPKLHEKYSKIVRALIHDVATVGRYIDLYTASHEEIERVDTQIAVLTAEAYAKGYKTEEDAMAYVDSQLKAQSAKGEEGKEGNKVGKLEKAAKSAEADSKSTNKEETSYQAAPENTEESSEEAAEAGDGEAQTSE